MPHCPSCGKVLKDHTSVARHMSQPRSGCNTWLDDIIKLNTIIPPTEDHPMDPMDNNGLPMPYYEPGLGKEDNTYVFHGQEEDIALEACDGIRDQGQDANSEVTDYFLNSPLAYEDGYTFLGLFDADENSIYHKINLYFPFSSRRDWQVTAWLLHSGLSMGKIDSFLSLDMIKDLPLSFAQPKNFEVEQKCSPVVHVGSPKSFLRRILLSHL